MSYENIEIGLLLDAVYQRYGYDFRNYTKASIKRRLRHHLSKSGLPNFSAMQHLLIYDDTFFKSLLLDLTVNVTEMFRDPSFYRSLRKNVIPILRTYPNIKIWHAGCSTGEEVYSMAILLEEEGLLDKAQIYATDIDDKVLETAKEGIYPVDRIKAYTENYQKAEGKKSFSDYYRAGYDAAIIKKTLKKNIVFTSHNLVTDSVFGEFHLIICRNVLIYFNKALQNHVLKLFEQSLIRRGILALGSKETVQFSTSEKVFSEFDKDEKIFQKNISTKTVV
jgi:chemotaxis protein methyltransferase CheR